MGRPHLTDDERLRVRVLRNDAKFTFSRITEITGYGERQIRNALKSATVAKRSGRPTALSPQQQAELVRFVTASKENRSLTYAEIGRALFGGVHGEYAIRNTLRRMGFKRSGPVLKQVGREGEKGKAGGAGGGEGAAAADAMDVTAEPGEDDSGEDEVMSEDEGRAEGQASREEQFSAVNQARRGDQTPTEERIATAAVAAVNATGPGDVVSQVPGTPHTGVASRAASQAPGTPWTEATPGAASQAPGTPRTEVASEAASQAPGTPYTGATPGAASQEPATPRTEATPGPASQAEATASTEATTGDK